MPAITYVYKDGVWQVISEIFVRKNDEDINIHDMWVKKDGYWELVFETLCSCNLRTCDCFSRSYCDGNIGCECENRTQVLDVCDCNHRESSLCQCQQRTKVNACSCYVYSTCSCDYYCVDCSSDCDASYNYPMTTCGCNIVAMCQGDCSAYLGCSDITWGGGVAVYEEVIVNVCDCNGRGVGVVRAPKHSTCTCKTRTGQSYCECDNRVVGCVCQDRTIYPVCDCNLRDNCSCVTRTTCDNNNVCSCEERGVALL